MARYQLCNNNNENRHLLNVCRSFHRIAITARHTLIVSSALANKAVVKVQLEYAKICSNQAARKLGVRTLKQSREL